jgi:hypothetical protein
MQFCHFFRPRRLLSLFRSRTQPGPSNGCLPRRSLFSAVISGTATSALAFPQVPSVTSSAHFYGHCNLAGTHQVTSSAHALSDRPVTSSARVQHDGPAVPVTSSAHPTFAHRQGGHFFRPLLKRADLPVTSSAHVYGHPTSGRAPGHQRAPRASLLATVTSSAQVYSTKAAELGHFFHSRLQFPSAARSLLPARLASLLALQPVLPTFLGTPPTSTGTGATMNTSLLPPTSTGTATEQAGIVAGCAGMLSICERVSLRWCRMLPRRRRLAPTSCATAFCDS